MKCKKIFYFKQVHNITSGKEFCKAWNKFQHWQNIFFPSWYFLVVSIKKWVASALFKRNCFKIWCSCSINSFQLTKQCKRVWIRWWVFGRVWLDKDCLSPSWDLKFEDFVLPVACAWEFGISNEEIQFFDSLKMNMWKYYTSIYYSRVLKKRVYLGWTKHVGLIIYVIGK